MAISLRIGCPGNNHSFAEFGINNNWCSLRSRATRLRPVMLVGDQSPSRGQNWRITAAATLTTTPVMTTTELKNDFVTSHMEQSGTGDRAGGKEAVYASDRLDKWMRDSVVEIVKNLREAPLLVQVFPNGNVDDDDGNRRHMTTETTATLVTERRAIEENWPAAREKWRHGRTPSPEGLILVEELAGDVSEKEKAEGTDKTTKTWGVVIQGRRAECGPVYYLLKTTRVRSSQRGPWCTHFCLTRVQNFGETLESQFKNVWRVQSQDQ